MAGPDYIVELGDAQAPTHKPQPAAAQRVGRPWLAIYWKCCSVYSRIYRRAEASAYHGRCPRCGRPVHVRVAPDGTPSRFFEAQ